MYEIGSEFHYEEPVQEENLLQLFDSFHDVRFMRCGRDAIGLIADDILKHESRLKPEDCTAFLPALSCDSMYLPFTVRGFQVMFYALQENLLIDMDSLEKQMRGVKHPVILTMNLYGCADQRKANAILRKKYPNAILIEDVTHILLDPMLYDTDAMDYCIGSIRKWMGVPDGAVVISNNGSIQAHADKAETDFTHFREQALRLKTDYLDMGDPELKNRFRGMLAEAEDSLKDGCYPHEMTASSKERLSHTDLNRMRHRRTVNYHILYTLLQNMQECGDYFTLLPEVPEEVTPFTLPIVLNPDKLRADEAVTAREPGALRDVFEKHLAGYGIYAPVLWPIAGEARKICTVSEKIADNMIAFWIDQRYSRFDMEHAAEIFRKTLLE